MNTHANKLFLAGAVVAATLTAGCGGSSSPKNAAPAAAASGAPAALAAAISNGAKALAAVSGQLDVSKQCAAIKTADVQALLKSPVGDPVSNPLECGWKNTDLKVDLSPNDADKTSYNALVSTEGHAIAGLGDVAQWFQPVNGSTPDINAHKGSLTCYVQGVGDITTSTLPYTGSDPFFKTNEADALAYATNEAKLCAAIFSVSP
jgi:hypothetical protein